MLMADYTYDYVWSESGFFKEKQPSFPSAKENIILVKPVEELTHDRQDTEVSPNSCNFCAYENVELEPV